MIRVLYFASVRERLGRDTEDLSLVPTVAALRAGLAARGGEWAEVFGEDKRVLVAVNQTMANAEQRLQDGDEVGFFPPVTGG